MILETYNIAETSNISLYIYRNLGSEYRFITLQYQNLITNMKHFLVMLTEVYRKLAEYHTQGKGSLEICCVSRCISRTSYVFLMYLLISGTKYNAPSLINLFRFNSQSS